MFQETLELNYEPHVVAGFVLDTCLSHISTRTIAGTLIFIVYLHLTSYPYWKAGWLGLYYWVVYRFIGLDGPVLHT